MYIKEGYQPIKVPTNPKPPKNSGSGVVKEGDRCDCCKCRKDKK